jgi:uncharacterized membrane protein
MDSIRPVLAALAALAVFWWLHLRHFLPRLPERIATHFDGKGVPKGWMSRATLGSFDFVFLVFVLSVVIGSALLVRALPATWINLPNRDHWFAPERRRQSHRRLLIHTLWFACALVAFLIGVNHLVFLANLQPAAPRLSGIGIVSLLVAFLSVVVVWTVRLYRLFPRPPRP